MDSTITPRSIPYGPGEDQVGDLYLPAGASPPVVCLLHGGFWRRPHGRGQMDAIALDLAARGFAVWNLGYRCVGTPGGGWPGTLEDPTAGAQHLAAIMQEGVALDLDRVTLVGHSAGGHLALWTAAQGRGASGRVRVARVAGLAPVTDLLRAQALGLGKGAVTELLGLPPLGNASLYQQASPRARLPLGIPQLLIHGTADPAVPIEFSRDYAQAAREAGDPVELVELEGAGHMEFLDPASAAHGALCRWLGSPRRP